MNFLRIFVSCALPDDEDEMGKLAQICFDFMEKNWEKAAIKIYCIDILFRISELEPELKPELSLIIEKEIPYNSVAFRSRGTKILKKLNAYYRKL